MTGFGRTSLVILGSTALLLSAASGCSSPDSGPRGVAASGSGSGATSGNPGSAGSDAASGSGGTGSGGSGGSSSTAGSGGTAGAAEPSCMILPVANPMISEFTPPEGSGAGGGGGEGGAAAPGSEVPGKISFGYDADPPTVASGFSFFYPEATLTSDMSEGVWHLSGSVAEYAGFQIAFVCGADAKAYQGISFKISGSAGPSNTLSFVVAHASDTWRDPASTEPSAASCVSANQYDGTCKEASVPIEVGETETTISLMWDDIEGGKPEANPDPSELLGLRWIFKWDEAMAADAAANAYDVDIRLDDLTFIE